MIIQNVYARNVLDNGLCKWLFFTWTIVLFGCNSNETKDKLTHSASSISQSIFMQIPHAPPAILPHYLPKIDTINNLAFSVVLQAAGQPVLYNSFRPDSEIYRFSWIPAFHPPMVIAISKTGEQVWMQTVVFNRFPEMNDGTSEQFKTPEDVLPRGQIIQHLPESETVTDTISYPISRLPIQSWEDKQLTMQQWNSFEALLQSSEFWHTPSVLDHGGITDGTLSLIEGYKKNRYRFTQIPNGELEKAEQYLFGLAGLKAKAY